MDRRNFFKGMFGAAIVAAIPKVVVKQIEKIPIKEITPAPVLEKPKQVIYHLGEQCMYLYDNNQLIAGSTLFSLDFHRQVMDVSLWEQREYFAGLCEWKVVAEQLRWFNYKSGKDYIMNDKPLQCVLFNRGTILKGEVLITECALTCSIIYPIQEDVTLTGIGLLTITTEDE